MGQDGEGRSGKKEQEQEVVMDQTPSTSQTILQSAYFQPKIIDAYLRSCLTASDFPTSQLDALKSLPGNCRREEEDDGGRVYFDGEVDESKRSPRSTIPNEYERVVTSLTAKQKAELAEAIKALSSSLLTARRHADQTNESVQAEHRCLLGYCKLLNRQWPESIVDFDMVRNTLYNSIIRVRKKGKEKISFPDGAAPAGGEGEMGKGAAAAAAALHIYIEALDGLQIASMLLGKKLDAARYAKWKGQAVAEI